MNAREYADFDLLFQTRTGGGYDARVVESPAGPSSRVAFDAPFAAGDLDAFLEVVGRPRRRVRGGGSPAARAVEEFGGRLFETVFRDEVRDRLISSLDLSRRQGRALRLRLRLGDAPDLVDLPWESLYDTGRRTFLALSEWTPVVRYLDLPGPEQSLRVTGPLQVLVMIAQYGGYQPLDVEDEWNKLQEAVSDLQDAGRLTLVRMSVGNLVELQRTLRRGAFHVFHFIGHGLFDDDTGKGQLIVEGTHGQGVPVSGDVLARRLGDHRTLRLVVLNSCEGARAGLADPFAGTAQAMVLQGVPAVIAMQFEIGDQAAITFSQGLYEALADGSPVDDATTQARQMVESTPNPVEWITPVLYLRADDGHLFELGPPATGGAPLHTRQDRPGPDALSTLDEARPAARGTSAEIESGPRGQQAVSALWARAKEEFDRVSSPRAAEITLATGGASAVSVAFSSDSSLLATGCGRWTQLWELRTGDRVWAAKSPKVLKYINGVAISSDGSLVGSANDDGTASVLDATTGQELLWLPHANRVLAVTFCTDGRWLVTGSADNTARVWDCRSGDELLRVPHGGPVWSVALTLDRCQLATAASNGGRICDARTGRKIRLVRHERSNGVAFSPDGTRLATAGLDKTARLWDVTTGQELLNLRHKNALAAVALSPDGTRLATACADRTARLWDVSTARELLKLRHKKIVTAVAFSPDGTRLATGSWDGNARVWDLGDELAQT